MKVLFRMERIKRENITKAVKHDFRLTYIPHANPDEPIEVVYKLPSFNATIDGKTYKVKLSDYSKLPDYFLGGWDYINLKRLEKGLSPFRKNTAPAVEFIIAFSKDSREFVNNPENWKKLDEKVREYLEILKKEYGVIPIVAVRHSDETTTHYHILAFNFSPKTGKTLTKTFTRKELSRLQDLLAETFKPLGFERGKKYTPQTPPEQRRHKKPAILRMELEQEIHQLEQQRKKLLQELELLHLRREEEELRLKELQQQLQSINKELEEKQQILLRHQELFKKTQPKYEVIKKSFEDSLNRIANEHLKKPLIFGEPKIEFSPEEFNLLKSRILSLVKAFLNYLLPLAELGSLSQQEIEQRIEQEIQKRVQEIKQQLEQEKEKDLDFHLQKYKNEIKELKRLLEDYQKIAKIFNVNSLYEAKTRLKHYKELEKQIKNLTSENKELKNQLQNTQTYYQNLLSEIFNLLHAHGLDLASDKNGNLILVQYEPPNNTFSRKI